MRTSMKPVAGSALVLMLLTLVPTPANATVKPPMFQVTGRVSMTSSGAQGASKLGGKRDIGHNESPQNGSERCGARGSSLRRAAYQSSRGINAVQLRVPDG